MTLTRRPGVPPRRPPASPTTTVQASLPADLVPHVEILARSGVSVDLIVSEITRIREGRTRFVDAALTAPKDWAPNADLKPAAAPEKAPEPFGAEFDVEIDPENPLGFLDVDRPPVDQPHSLMTKKPRRPGVRS
jgi:hypothetical protein